MKDFVAKAVQIIGVGAITLQVGLIGYSIRFYKEFWGEIDLRIQTASASDQRYVDNVIAQKVEIRRIKDEHTQAQMNRIEQDLKDLKSYIMGK